MTNIRKTHAYFSDNSEEYYDYTFIASAPDWCVRDWAGADTVIDDNTWGKLRDRIALLPSKVGSVPKGSTIYLTPGCPYASADIRKHYKVKRLPDTGDYNIFSFNDIWTRNVCFDDVVAISDKKLIVAKYSGNLILQDISDLTGMPLEEVTMLQVKKLGIRTIRTRELNSGYLSLLNNTLKKPCYSYKALDITNENELTYDLLNLIFVAGKKMRYEPDAIKNYKILLNALNQCNWREYPGTVSMLLGILSGCGSSAHRYLTNHGSALSAFQITQNV